MDRNSTGLSTPCRTARHLLELLWLQAPDHAFILLDVEGKVVGWGGAAAETFGYPEGEMLGQHFELLFTDEDRCQGLPAYEREVAISAGRSDDDRWMQRKDGTLVWTSGSLIALKENGRLVGLAKLVTDRTDKRAQLETLQNRLDAAKRGLKKKNEFFGRVIHEVRNALFPVVSAIALLEKTPGAERGKLPMAVIKRQVAQMERMMLDLADVARFHVGKLQLAKQDLDLGKELAEIVEAVRETTEAKQLALTVIVPPSPVVIHADRQRVHQIVYNLLHNAIKYTPPGGQVWAYCSKESEHGVVKVEDTGIGIAPELLPVIFDLFTQEHPEQSEGGFGVGLSLVKELVDAHDGFVEVKCDGKGKGSVFAVRLPLARH
ncbi:conserved hypothetical protein [Burkholderiales bacterium 8X]|nr:conserved hypothetical protein [Burkholderiales bacterium 8X]